MQITRKHHFIVAPAIKNAVTCKFLNRLGGWDALQFTKYKLDEVKLSPTTFSTKFGTLVSSIKADTVVTYFSTLLTEAQYHWLKDLQLSPRIVVNDRLMNIIPGSVKFDNDTDFYEMELSLTPSVDEKYLRF